MSAMFGYGEDAPNFEEMSMEIVHELEMPELILNPNVGIDNFLQRYPEMEEDFKLEIKEDEAEIASLKRGLILSKLLINVFGPNSQSKSVTAQQYAQWLKDVEALERACGCPKGGLRGNGPQVGQGLPNGKGEGEKGAGNKPGSGFDIPLDEIRVALAS